MTVQQLLQELGIDVKDGLNDEMIARNRDEYGTNYIEPPKGRSIWSILLGQTINAINLILIVVVIVCAVNKEWIDMGVVCGIIMLNIVIGFISEAKSESSLSALQTMTKGMCHVLRDGTPVAIPIDDVVVGDILILRNGDILAADARVIESSNLEVSEILLTGESVPVYKGTEALPLPTTVAGMDVRVSIADRSNMVFRSTTIVGGSGLAIVSSTGMNTKIGTLAKRIETSASGKTHFQKNMNIMMYILFAVAIVLSLLIFAIVKFDMSGEIIVYAASTAIALLPESLIMVTTIALALAMTRLARRKAVVRKMNVLTDLSALNVAISDKTQTLTIGRMVMKRFWLPNAPNYIYHVPGGYDDASCGGFGVEFDPTDTTNPITEQFQSTRLARAATRANTRSMSLYGTINPQSQAETSRIRAPSFNHNVMKVLTGTPEGEISKIQEIAEELALVAAMCNNTILQVDEENDRLVGVDAANPTEAALTVWTYKLNMPPHYFEDQYGWMKIGSHAFDSKVKRMSVGLYRHKTDEQGNIIAGEKDSIVLVKGAPEAILPLCNKSTVSVEEIMHKVNHLSSQGFRVLACATSNHLQLDDQDGMRLHEYDRALVEKENTFKFVGLCVVFDPPREESFVAVEKCKRAGITFVMATGDNPLTATNIARTLKILDENDGDDRIMTGPVIDAMSEEQLDALEQLPLCIGRCSPESKTKLVEAYRRRGGIVSVTGDGVNDCPALSAANCGFGMGIAGTELTKQTADIVLLDDNIATMVDAIEQGRAISASIGKFLTLLLVSNIAEVVVLLIGLVFRDKGGEVVFPLMALEILTINTITSSPPAIALTMDDPDHDTMDQPPAKPGAFFTKELVLDLIFYGLIVAALSFGSYLIVIFGFGNGDFGTHCNTKAGFDSCKLIWRARTTGFAVMYELLLVQAWMCRHQRKSLLDTFFPLNGVLIASFVLGTLFLLPIIYIPWVAKNLYKHGSISWEWAVVAVCILLHLLLGEGWKLWKRWMWGPKPNVFKRSEGKSPSAKKKNDVKKGYVTTEDGGVIELR